MINKDTLTKDWGSDYFVFSTDAVIVRRLEIKKGGKSTFGNFHKHKTKYNRFYVESGLLKIFMQTASGIKEHIIGPSETYRKIDVFPDIKHRFEALEETIAYEFYWIFCHPDDIVRYDELGKVLKV